MSHLDIFLLSTKWREKAEDGRESGSSAILTQCQWTRARVPWDKVRHQQIEGENGICHRVRTGVTCGRTRNGIGDRHALGVWSGLTSRARDGSRMSGFCCGPTDEKMKIRCSELSRRELHMHVCTLWSRLCRRR